MGGISFVLVISYSLGLEAVDGIMVGVSFL